MLKVFRYINPYKKKTFYNHNNYLGNSTGINCEDGLIVPLWPGTDHMSMGDRFGRGLLYGTLMIYLFIGVAIVSDKFMESIEMITAQVKEVQIKDPRTGKTQVKKSANIQYFSF